jgi:hypothetical protein
MVCMLLGGRAGGAQIATRAVGGCITLTLRVGEGTPVSLDQFCQAYPATVAGEPFQKLYGWAPPLLASALDAAETASCGYRSCASKKANLRVTILSYGLPNAAVFLGPNVIDIFVTSGLIDFVDATARGMLIDARASGAQTASEDGYRSWLERMHDSGGQTCAFTGHRGPGGLPVTNSQQWLRDQTGAITVYEFVFGHELAHVLNGPSCGYSGADVLSREVACDESAFRHLMTAKSLSGERLPVYAPSLTFYFMAAMRHYEQLLGPHLLSMFRGPDGPRDLDSLNPARDWRSRARVLLDDWRAMCRNDNKDVMCRYWEDLTADARVYIESLPPRPCVER